MFINEAPPEEAEEEEPAQEVRGKQTYNKQQNCKFSKWSNSCVNQYFSKSLWFNYVLNCRSRFRERFVSSSRGARPGGGAA